jgi:raffinose/stachyose/melibiose transport system permease protein
MVRKVVFFSTAILSLLAPFASAKVTIDVPLFEGGAGKEFFLRCAREYEKLRPDVKVDLYLDPRIDDKVRVRVLEGSFPEVTNPGTINYWPLIRNGDVAQLDKYLDGPNWEGDARWRDTFLPGSLDNYSENGKHYGLPFGYYAFVIWYNKKMFHEHGWETPRTWDELFALCEKVKAVGIAPMAFQGRYPYYAKQLYEAAYYHLAGPAQWQARQLLAPGAISNEAGIEAIRLTSRLAHNYFQQGALGMSHTEAQQAFFLGQTAMIPCGAWLKSEMKATIPDGFEMGCFNLPIAANSKADPSAVQVYSEPFFIFSRAKNFETGIDFMRFMTSRKMAGLFAKMQDIPTAIRGANEGNLSADMNDLVKIVGQAKASYGTTSGEGYPLMVQQYNDMMSAIISKDIPPAELAQKYETIGQAIRQRELYPDRVDVRHRGKPAVLLGILALGAIYWIWRTARDIRRRSTRPRMQAGRVRMGYGNVLLFVAPAFLLYSLFVIIPCLRSFSWSVHTWNGLTPMAQMPFKGLLNFRRLLQESDAFWIALKNNLFLMFVIPLFVIPLALFLAASISRGVRGATLFRVVFFFPNLVGGVAATLLWLHLYNPNGGLVNTALSPILKPIAPSFMRIGQWLMGHHGCWHVGVAFTAVGNFMANISHFTWLESSSLYWALIPISIWGAVGFNMVLYLAAMESIPESYYEAATLDGATKWRQFWTITLPLIWDIMAISIVFLVIGGMKAFEVIWLLGNQRPLTNDHVIATRMVQTMFNEFNVGEATALAVLLFLMVFVGSAATLRGMRRETVEL